MMPKSKIVLSSSRDIPFDKLVLSQANVRRIKAARNENRKRTFGDIAMLAQRAFPRARALAHA